MKLSAQLPPMAEPKKGAASSVRLPTRRGAGEEWEDGRDEQMREALEWRATRSVQTKAAVDTGYDGVIAVARAPAVRVPAPGRAKVDQDPVLEAEADRVAAAIVGGTIATQVAGAGTRGAAQRYPAPTIQCRPMEAHHEPAKKPEDDEKDEKEVLEVEGMELLQAKLEGEAHVPATLKADISSLRGAGMPLPQETRDFFEPRFGQDFRQVRVHTGAAAAETASSINARAYTIGQDIVFGPQHYDPTSHAGRLLLAHELTHVVQQGSASGSSLGIQRPRTTTES